MSFTLAKAAWRFVGRQKINSYFFVTYVVKFRISVVKLSVAVVSSQINVPCLH